MYCIYSEIFITLINYVNKYPLLVFFGKIAIHPIDKVIIWLYLAVVTPLRIDHAG